MGLGLGFWCPVVALFGSCHVFPTSTETKESADTIKTKPECSVCRNIGRESWTLNPTRLEKPPMNLREASCRRPIQLD